MAAVFGVLLFMPFLTAVQAAVTVTPLHWFPTTNGYVPGTLIQGADGNFYGTTLFGGAMGPGWGTVYRMTPDGDVTTLVNFGGTNGSWASIVLQGSDGNFYGATAYGGHHFDPGPIYGGTTGYGKLFKMTPDGSLTTLFSFAGTNGMQPDCLFEASDGRLYGLTYYGGIGSGVSEGTGYGTAFTIDTNGSFNTIVYFNGTNGAGPCGLIEGKDGNFFGMTARGGTFNSGTIFRMSSDGALTTLASFDGTNGARPVSLFVLIQLKDDSLLGVTPEGGPSGNGTIFKMTTNGVFLSVVGFAGTNGSDPRCIMMASDGNAYGAALGGGLYDHGAIFRRTPDGSLTAVVSFDGTNALPPESILFQGRDGNFYCTTTPWGWPNPYGPPRGILRVSLPLAPVLQAPVLTNGGIALNWSAVASQSYQLQYATDLGSTNWTNLGGVMLATNGSLTATDSLDSTQRFYRAVVLP